MTEKRERGGAGRGSLPANLALLLGTLVLLGVVGEVLVREYQERLIVRQLDRLGIHVGGDEAETWKPWLEDGEGHFHVRSSNPVLVYENRPNADVVVQRGGRQIAMRTNSSGFRDEEFTPVPREGVFRIAAVGDSVTIGLFFEPGDVYPKIAEAILNESGSDCEFEVYNMGTTGYNVRQEVELIETKVADFHPDLVTVGYVFNDDEIGQDAGLWAHFNRSPLRLWDFLRFRWLALEERMRSTTLTERSFADLGAWSREHHTPVLVVVFPLMDRGGPERAYRHADLHANVARFATRNGLRVLDLLEPFAAAGVLDKTDGDTIHPPARGHRIAGRAIASFVLERVGSDCDAVR